ncbi:hypothetical protein CgunFtcFv8_010113 [Champsocephalus gunnari]|uniref:Uncharacterized protein n=1 Tax=Champsocephalus gunnari TaxID=52237 RepID=A0AAN8E259_CHAGU|nr:hypothetical protein CgunFtcFv8_010113 [Champsocephalus gunnari]
MTQSAKWPAATVRVAVSASGDGSQVLVTDWFDVCGAFTYPLGGGAAEHQNKKKQPRDDPPPQAAQSLHAGGLTAAESPLNRSGGSPLAGSPHFASVRLSSVQFA